MKRMMIFLVLLIAPVALFSQRKLETDTVKVRSGLKIKGVDRTSLFDNLSSGNKVGTAALADSEVTLQKLSPTVNILAGGAGTYAPDDVKLEFKIVGNDTLISVKDAFLDTTKLGRSYRSINGDISKKIGSIDSIGIRPHLLNEKVINLSDFANGDLRVVNDAIIRNDTLTSSSASFSSFDVGKSVTIDSAGPSGSGFSTTILSLINSSSVKMAAAATSNVTNERAAFGTDVTSFVQQAIDSSISLGKTLFIPNDLGFGITSSLSISSGLRIKGEGTNSVIAMLADNMNLISGTSIQKLIIENMSLVGNNTSSVATNGNLISITGGSQIIVRNCMMTNFASRALTVTDVDSSMFYGNLIVQTKVDHDAFDASGIQLLWGCDSNIIRDNLIVNYQPYLSTLDLNTGIFIQRNLLGKPGPKNNIVSGNILHGWNKYGIMLYSSNNNVAYDILSDSVMVHNSIVGNTIRKTNFMGIYQNGGDFTTVSGNHLDSCGISISDENIARGGIAHNSGRYCSYTNNVVTNQLKYHGMSFNKAFGSIVTGNIIWKCDRNGIRVVSAGNTSGPGSNATFDIGADAMNISNNVIERVGEGGSIGNGIRVIGQKLSVPVTDINISSNFIRNGNQSGILIIAATRARIQNNNISDFERRGIDADSLNLSIVSGNIIEQIDTLNVGHPAIILGASSDNNHVFNNFAHNVSSSKGFTYGVQVNDASDDNNIVTNNVVINGRLGSFSDLGTATILLNPTPGQDYTFGQGNDTIILGSGDIKVGDTGFLTGGVAANDKIGFSSGSLSMSARGGLTIDMDSDNNDTNRKMMFTHDGGVVILAMNEGGNVGVGTQTFDASATSTVAIINGTSPATGTPNQSYIYAKDVAASSEMFVMDEAGNQTQISPHDPKTGEWIYYSHNKKTGRILRVDMEKMMFALSRIPGFGGFIHEELYVVDRVEPRRMRYFFNVKDRDH